VLGCGESKLSAEFGRNRTRGDGLSFYCLECTRERNRRWYRESRRKLGRQVRDHSWIPEGFRWCPACEQPVAHEDYARNSRTRHGFGSRCRSCKAAADRAAYFLRTYGLREADVVALRARQGNRCSLCGDPDPGHVDHDHSSGRVRGLLCERCNLALGLFRDDAHVMRCAADYVEQPRSPQTQVEVPSGSRQRSAPAARRSPDPVASMLRRRAAGCRADHLVRARVAAVMASLERPAGR
jgi:hypothetical protein